MPVNVALVGGGHAHIEVIRSFRADPPPGTRLQVFDPQPRAIYSGMVPGLVAGNYMRADLEVDLEALCAHEQIDFTPSAVSLVDATRGELHLESGSSATYDMVSLDIGSTVAGCDRPGVREFALASRPIQGLISEVSAIFDRAKQAAAAPFRIQIVGAGAGGIELAFGVEAQLRREATGAYEVALVTSDSSILQGASPALRRRVERALEKRGIQTHLESPVSAVCASSIEIAGGTPLASDAVLWVTGPAAHPLAARSGLACDSHGFARVRPTLQSVDHDNLFAVGDCASLPGLKKAGVYAVRAGPVLDRNLRAQIDGRKLSAFKPQPDFLSLLNLGDGTAIGTKWGIALEGRFVMRIKNRIDRAFIAKYREH